MLLSTSGTRTTLPQHTCDTTPVKSKVALRITATQGIDYYSTVRTVPTSLHWEGHRRRTNCRTVVDTLYIVITVPRSRYTCVPNVEPFNMKESVRALCVEKEDMMKNPVPLRVPL